MSYGGSPSSTGVFPDQEAQGIVGVDKTHVHAITLNGIVWRVSVTFINGSEHVGNAFYFPVPTRSRTYSRFCTRIPKYSEPARDLADDIFEGFYNACAKTPGNTANDKLVEATNQIIASKALAAEKEAEEKKAAATKKIEVADVKGYGGIFGQATSSTAPSVSHEDAVARVEAYKAKGIALDAGETKAIIVCIKECRAKEAWVSFVRKYYEGVMA
jgi:hypothetical protein